MTGREEIQGIQKEIEKYSKLDPESTIGESISYVIKDIKFVDKDNGKEKILFCENEKDPKDTKIFSESFYQGPNPEPKINDVINFDAITVGEYLEELHYQKSLAEGLSGN